MSTLMNSSSGYEALSNSPLARPYYHSKIIAKGWETDFLPLITNTAIAEPLTSCYQLINFLREPEVGPWRDLEFDQTLVPDYLSPDGFSMRICNAAYKALKFDKHDVAMICDRWDMWEDAFLKSAWNGLAAMWRCYVLDSMLLEADACNKGCNAGIYGDINVGCTGAPRVITGASFASEVAKLQRILTERNRWYDGEMFIIIPPAIKEMLYQTPYADALNMGNCVDCSILATGQLPGMIAGFNVYHTNDVHVQLDGGVNGNPAYHIIAGHRDAFAFAGDIIESRIVEPSSSFSVQYQMAAIWGGQAIYPDALAVGYWTV